jgi:hypothetical protein
MHPLKKLLSTRTLWIAFAGCLIFSLRLTPPGRLAIGLMHPCIDSIKQVLHDRSGIDFTLVETSCDTFGNDLSHNVYASTSENPRRTLLFKYGPDERSPLPQILVNGKTILISVDSVDDVMKQIDRYDAYAIEYRINHVGFPAAFAPRKPGNEIPIT